MPWAASSARAISSTSGWTRPRWKAGGSTPWSWPTRCSPWASCWTSGSRAFGRPEASLQALYFTVLEESLLESALKIKPEEYRRLSREDFSWPEGVGEEAAAEETPPASPPPAPSKPAKERPKPEQPPAPKSPKPAATSAPTPAPTPKLKPPPRPNRRPPQRLKPESTSPSPWAMRSTGWISPRCRKSWARPPWPGCPRSRHTSWG